MIAINTLRQSQTLIMYLSDLRGIRHARRNNNADVDDWFVGGGRFNENLESSFAISSFGIANMARLYKAWFWSSCWCRA